MSEAQDTPIKRNRFRRPARDPAHTPEREARQSLITHLAFAQLGGRDEAMEFLNAPWEPLGVTRLDRAMAGPAEYAQIEEELRRLGSPKTAKMQ